MTERSASPATAPVAAAPADQPTPPTEDPSTTTEDRMSTQPTTSTTVEAAVAPTSAERLSRGEPYVLAFGGQATPWRATLDEFVGLDRDLASVLVEVDAAVAARLAPVATDLLTITPRGARFLTDDAVPVTPAVASADGAAADTAPARFPSRVRAASSSIIVDRDFVPRAAATTSSPVLTAVDAADRKGLARSLRMASRSSPSASRTILRGS